MEEFIMEARSVWLAAQGILSAGIGVLGLVMGGFDALIIALVVCMGLDYLSGVCVAVIDRKLCSNIGFRGIFRKVMIFILVAVGHIIDDFIIGTGSGIRTLVIMFYISNETVSIIENAAMAGLPIPQGLVDILAQIRKKERR
jgi:toxin secretion/phage lysis holin